MACTRPPHMGRQFTRLTLSFIFHTAMGYGSKYFGEGCMLGILNTTDLFIRKAFDIHFDTNESDNKLILLERRFDVIFTSFSSSIKVRYFFNCSYDEFVIAQANNYIKSQSHAQLNCGKCTRLYFLLQLS